LISPVRLLFSMTFEPAAGFDDSVKKF